MIEDHDAQASTEFEVDKILRLAIAIEVICDQMLKDFSIHISALQKIDSVKAISQAIRDSADCIAANTIN